MDLAYRQLKEIADLSMFTTVDLNILGLKMKKKKHSS